MTKLLHVSEVARKLLDSGTPAVDVYAQIENDIFSKSSNTGSRKLSVQLGDGTMRRTLTRLNEWRRNIIKAEEKRLRKTISDMWESIWHAERSILTSFRREQTHHVSELMEWVTTLVAERGLWSAHSDQRQWQLDETEGPYRVR